MESDIIKQRTYALIDRVGTTRDKVIPLLQAIQQEFNYLPADALNCVYERTDIDRAQLLSVATFSGWLLGGPVGIGTLISTFAMGPIMQMAFTTVKFDATSVHHQHLIESLKTFRRENNGVYNRDF